MCSRIINKWRKGMFKNNYLEVSLFLINEEYNVSPGRLNFFMRTNEELLRLPFLYKIYMIAFQLS